MNRILKILINRSVWEYGIFYNGKHAPNEKARRNLITGKVQVLWFQDRDNRSEGDFNFYSTVHKDHFKHFTSSK